MNKKPVNLQEIDFFLSTTLRLIRKKGSEGLKEINQNIRGLEKSEDLLDKKIVQQIFSTACNHFKIVPEDLRSTKRNRLENSNKRRGWQIQTRDRIFIRKICIKLCMEHTKLNDGQIAMCFNTSKQTMSHEKKVIAELNRESRIDKPFFDAYDNLNTELSILIEKDK